MLLEKGFFYVSVGTKISCLHKNSLWKSCMENSRSWTVNFKMPESSEEFRHRNAKRTSIAVSFLFLTWLMKILLLLSVRTDLAEGSVSFNLWKANFVNTALHARLDWIFLPAFTFSYLECFILRILFSYLMIALPPVIYLCPLACTISVVSLLHCLIFITLNPWTSNLTLLALWASLAPACRC